MQLQLMKIQSGQFKEQIMSKFIPVFLILIFGLIFFSCTTKSENRPDVVAQVNESVMTNEELEEAITDAASPDIKMALKRKLMEKWIEDEIFYQAAISEEISLTPYEENLILNYRKRLFIENYLAKYINKNYRILDQEIEDYYSNHRREFFWETDYVNIIHLVLENDERVIKNEIAASKDLMEVITKNFFDQKSTNERPIGNLGYIRVSDLPSGLASRIKNTKTGTIRGPIKTDLGYHYFQLLDYQKEGNLKELDVVKDEIVHRLKIQKRRNEIEKLKRSLRKNYNIQTDLSKLTSQ
jgi:predicted XRE-type DNA-binding protein